MAIFDLKNVTPFTEPSVRLVIKEKLLPKLYAWFDQTSHPISLDATVRPREETSEVSNEYIVNFIRNYLSSEYVLSKGWFKAGMMPYPNKYFNFSFCQRATLYLREPKPEDSGKGLAMVFITGPEKVELQFFGNLRLAKEVFDGVFGIEHLHIFGSNWMLDPRICYPNGDRYSEDGMPWNASEYDLVQALPKIEQAEILISDILNITWTVKVSCAVEEETGKSVSSIDACVTGIPDPKAVAVLRSLDPPSQHVVEKAIGAYHNSVRHLSEIVAKVITH